MGQVLDSGGWGGREGGRRGDGRKPGGVEVIVNGVDFCLEE